MTGSELIELLKPYADKDVFIEQGEECDYMKAYSVNVKKLNIDGITTECVCILYE